MFENEQNQKPKDLIVKYYKEKDELLAERKKNKKVKSKIPTMDMLTDDQRNLYDYLRGFRREIASKQNVAPFVVFNNTSLIDMCLKEPQTLADFRNIYGVGECKQKRYGELFISKIEEYYRVAF